MVVGITGGIATGKSQVTRLLALQGATTFSADDAARAVLTPNGPVLQAIVRTFGPEMLLPDGQLNRAQMASRIFADPPARETLNRIMHPPIRRLLYDQIESAQEDLPPGSVVAVEIPLLFENNLQHWFERIVVVTASESIQVARLMTRNGLSEAEARNRLAAQWPLADKVARADDVIVNEGSWRALECAVEALWKRLTSPPKQET
ncbi:MAG TPA: dephospho-CoA kinase [Chthonomonadaceae bacterium]|nr:dephospho-CoA kinase [Chthonomonadaceae bacterium]